MSAHAHAGHQVEQAATELQTFSQLKKQEDVAIPRRQEVNLMPENSDSFGGDFFTARIDYLCSFICITLGPTGGCGEANGERERAAAEIRRDADGERGAGQQHSEILSNSNPRFVFCATNTQILTVITSAGSGEQQIILHSALVQRCISAFSFATYQGEFWACSLVTRPLVLVTKSFISVVTKKRKLQFVLTWKFSWNVNKHSVKKYKVCQRLSWQCVTLI